MSLQNVSAPSGHRPTGQPIQVSQRLTVSLAGFDDGDHAANTAQRFVRFVRRLLLKAA